MSLPMLGYIPSLDMLPVIPLRLWAVPLGETPDAQHPTCH